MAKPFRIAAVVTAFFPHSHADVLLTRWLMPRPDDSQWGWTGPHSELVSLYCQQFTEYEKTAGAKDLARELSGRHHLPIYPTIRDALTLGGKHLAVDGVMLIAEHGEYPIDALQRKHYPRKEFFDQIVQVLQSSGTTVPVFCDKHLSWNFDWARQMVETARSMGFMLLAGSSLPHCRHRPFTPAVKGLKIHEAVEVHHGVQEPYHGVEYVLSLIEQRSGGEAGVKSITAYQGDEVWRQQEAGRWSSYLMEAALAACDPRDVTPGDVRQNMARPPTAMVVEHRDGLQATYLNLTGHVKTWSAAFSAGTDKEVMAASPVLGGVDVYFAHFATLGAKIEEAFLTGRPPFPLERVLLSTGVTAAALKALARPGVTLDTPELAIAYTHST